MKNLIKQVNNRNLLRKFFSIIIVILLVMSISNTQAYFNDEAIITGNTFTAGTLDLELNPYNLKILDLDEPTNLSVIKQGNLDFEYDTTISLNDGSDIIFCGQLNIKVTKGTEILYDNSLNGLYLNELVATNQEDLVFTITDSGSNIAGKVCLFNFNFKAWQDELDFSQGFTDTEYSSAVIYSADTNILTPLGGVVLNEFLPNPNGYEYGFDFGSDSSDMPQGEWIELYNNNDNDVDLTGWYIKDLADHKIEILSTNTQPLSTIIPAHGWLVIYMNSSILNNTDPETITLYNDIDNVQDSYSYDSATYCDMEPTPENNNDTNPSGDCNSVPGNKSYARIPDGIGAWVDPIPTPGKTNEIITDDDQISNDAILEEILPDPEENVNQEEIITDNEILDEEIEQTPTEEEEADEEIIIGEEVINNEEEMTEEPPTDPTEEVIEETAIEEEIVEEPVPTVEPTEEVFEEAPTEEEIVETQEEVYSDNDNIEGDKNSSPIEVINNEEKSE